MNIIKKCEIEDEKIEFQDFIISKMYNRMPNYCENTLIIKGSKSSLDEFMNTVIVDGELELETIVPLPDEKRETAINYWGTKWGCFDTVINRAFGRVVIEFYTAWNPYDLTVQLEMAEMFPSLHFILRYEERGMGFGGRVEAYTDEAGLSVYDHGELELELESCSDTNDVIFQ